MDLVGNHLELYRRNQTAIGVDVMGMLSLEERDDRLKHHLLASKELHPALISPESEYKVWVESFDILVPFYFVFVLEFMVYKQCSSF